MKYFILTGPGRTGTRWLTAQLNTSPLAAVAHDEFMPINLEASFKRWRQTTDVEVIGTASGVARYHLPALYEEFRPVIVFLWREPVALIKSFTEMAIQRSNPPRKAGGFLDVDRLPEHFESQAARNAHILFGDLETAMLLCSFHKIPIYHAAMEHYVTPSGFMDLAEFVGIDFTEPGCKFESRIEAKRTANSMPGHDQLPPIETWSYGTIKHIRDIAAALPNMRHGYERAAKGVCCVC